MKAVYLGLLGIIIVILLVCILYAHHRKTKASVWIVHLIGAALLGAVSYGLYIVLPSKPLVVAADAMYFWSTDLMCFFMLKFSFSYTAYAKERVPFERLIKSLVLIDGINLLLNSKSGLMFDVVSKDGTFGMNASYIDQFTAIQYMHLAFCYLILLYAIVRFVYKIMQASRIYKIKYLAVITPLVIVIACNAICVMMQFSLDISILLYAVLAIIICYNAFVLTPGKLVDIAQMIIADNTRQGMLCFDEKDNCIYMNKVIKEARENLSFLENVEQYFLNKQREFTKENRSRAKWYDHYKTEDRQYYYLLTYQMLFDKSNKKMGYYFTVDDETENIERYQEEKYKASHDPLTGLLNRESFFQEVDEQIQNSDEPRYMVVSDIKDFKLVNNLYGEEYGNKILIKQSDLIKKYKKPGTICGRIAGDKFGMVLLKEHFNREVFLESVDEINQYTKDKKLVVHYHIGIYDITGLKETAQVLYNRITLAISTVHNDYDRIFVEYNQEIMNQILEKKAILKDFDKALDEQQFSMYLQPQIARSGEVAGAEALVRWKHPERGLIFPDSFIEVLEEASLIHKLDLEIWNQAARKLAEWKSKGQKDIHISINISVRDFYYLDVYEELVNIVQKYDINPANLKLEITESAVMTDQKNNFAMLSRLKEYGFDIELDDFGSGYSSLNMLKDFHVDVLKIDRMFLRETDNIEKSKIILESVICLAKQLGMKIVTEGVETEEQVDSLLDMGCDYFQGYFYDKPIAVSDFEDKYMLASSLIKE